MGIFLPSIKHEQMPELAREIDALLEKYAGKKMGFAIVLIEDSKEGRHMNYVSNASNLDSTIWALMTMAQGLINGEHGYEHTVSQTNH